MNDDTLDRPATSAKTTAAYIEALNSAYRPTGDPELDVELRHDRHQFDARCYVCRGDVAKLAEAVLAARDSGVKALNSSLAEQAATIQQLRQQARGLRDTVDMLAEPLSEMGYEHDLKPQLTAFVQDWMPTADVPL